MCLGRVKWFDWDKAMGFIQQVDPSTGKPIEDVFVHGFLNLSLRIKLNMNIVANALNSEKRGKLGPRGREGEVNVW